MVTVTLNNSASKGGSAAAALAAAAAKGGGRHPGLGGGWLLGLAACSVSGLSSAYAGAQANDETQCVLVWVAAASTITVPRWIGSTLKLLFLDFAGVYFEKYVKGRFAASLWHRNIQLGLFGVPLSIGAFCAVFQVFWHAVITYLSGLVDCKDFPSDVHIHVLSRPSRLQLMLWQKTARPCEHAACCRVLMLPPGW